MRLNDKFDSIVLNQELAKANIFVSFRGIAMRVSPNVYNETSDITALLNCFKIARKKKSFVI